MLAFLWNLDLGEMVVIAVVAVLIFGKNLPEVAGRLFGQLRRVRRTVDDIRRETGIDRDVRDIRRSFRDIEQEAKVVDPLGTPTASTPAAYMRHLEDHSETDPAAEEPVTTDEDQADSPETPAPEAERRTGEEDAEDESAYSSGEA